MAVVWKHLKTTANRCNGAISKSNRCRVVECCIIDFGDQTSPTKMTGFFKLITTVISSEMARQKRVQRRRMKILSDPSTYVVAN